MSRPPRLTTFASLASAIGALLLPGAAVAKERTVDTASSGPAYLRALKRFLPHRLLR